MEQRKIVLMSSYLLFKNKTMQEHLLFCLENQEMSEFPITTKTISGRRKKQKKIILIENYCVCNLPACLGQVQCNKCSQWFHKHC
ncbi:hypothetical protein MAR_018313, partial [Mya arenaria]